MGNFVSGIHHVALKCDSEKMYEEALHFYKDLLGLRVYKQWGSGAYAATMLDTGAGCIELFASGKKVEEGGLFEHVAFVVEDVDACVSAVREAGYQITTEPGNVDIGCVPVYPVRIAFCIGPVGEVVEFFHER